MQIKIWSGGRWAEENHEWLIRKENLFGHPSLFYIGQWATASREQHTLLQQKFSKTVNLDFVFEIENFDHGNQLSEQNLFTLYFDLYNDDEQLFPVKFGISDVN